MSDLISQNLNMIFKTPKGETVHALKDLNFKLKKGELLTVLGPSGCGNNFIKYCSWFLKTNIWKYNFEW
jgi:ABC-type oligopeptide transport system ATPase subunit